MTRVKSGVKSRSADKNCQVTGNATNGNGHYDAVDDDRLRSREDEKAKRSAKGC